jgi:hypothetical protein
MFLFLLWRGASQSMQCTVKWQQKDCSPANSVKYWLARIGDAVSRLAAR